MVKISIFQGQFPTEVQVNARKLLMMVTLVFPLIFKYLNAFGADVSEMVKTDLHKAGSHRLF